jgi:hypothetical protein
LSGGGGDDSEVPGGGDVTDEPEDPGEAPPDPKSEQEIERAFIHAALADYEKHLRAVDAANREVYERAVNAPANVFGIHFAGRYDALFDELSPGGGRGDRLIARLGGEMEVIKARNKNASSAERIQAYHAAYVDAIQNIPQPLVDMAVAMETAPVFLAAGVAVGATVRLRGNVVVRASSEDLFAVKPGHISNAFGDPNRAATRIANARGDTVVGTGTTMESSNSSTLTYVGHGTRTRVDNMTARQFADFLAEQNLLENIQTIELIACDTGLGTFAEQLASLTGKTVIAPKGGVVVGPDGVPRVLGPDGQTKLPKGAGWKIEP